MPNKRKLTNTSVEEPITHRGRRRFSFLQANVPKAGLLWGTEGSVERVLDRPSDAGDLFSALEQYDENGKLILLTQGLLEQALAELMDKSYKQAALANFDTTNAEEFFIGVTEQVQWAKGRISAGIILEMCLKLVAARRAWKNSNRKFLRITSRQGRKSHLSYSIDRFIATVDPEMVATWLETFLVPVEGEQADDEMEIEKQQEPPKTLKDHCRQKRRMTMDRQHVPTTPPGRLNLESGMSRGWARAGHYAPERLSIRKRRTEEAPESPSMRRSKSSDQDKDVEMLVGNLVAMAINN